MVLSDQVKDRLLQAILDGRYPPGARIIETRVARELGTSQAPVREALRDLEGLGLVETAAFRGARVRRPTTDELMEAFTVRSHLESFGARLAIERLSDDGLSELEEYLDEMRRAARDNDVHAEAVADACFHGLIVHAAGNRTLQRVWEMLEPSSRTYITLIAPGADRRRIAELHAPVLEALRRRSATEAQRALDAHYAVVASTLANLWSGDGSAPQAQPNEGTR